MASLVTGASRFRPKLAFGIGLVVGVPLVMALGILLVLPAANVSVPTLPTSQSYHVAITGSDSNSGTASAPWRHINYAAAKVMAGDMVLVHGGTYDEQVTISASGTSVAPIVFHTLPTDRAVVSSRNLVLSRFAPLVNLVGSYVEFRGFE